MIQTQATYFDGVSSKPQQVELLLDSTNCVLVFYHSTGIMNRWPVYEIHLHQIGNSLEVQYGDTPSQLLKISDPVFIKDLKKLLKEKGKINWYQRLLDMGPKAHISIALLILGMIVLVYFFVLPKVAERAVFLIPESYDNTMGSSFYNQYIAFSTIDTARSEALTSFARKLNLENNKELKFTVVESDIINAFALPDGNIVVFTGIIELMEDYDELAGLLCHEVVHINERHSMKMLCRNLAGYIFLSVALSDVNSIIAIIGDNVQSLQSLTYSRHFEKEADLHGINLLISNNINPVGMDQLFRRLQKDYDKLIPEFISSHPVTENRIHYIEKIIKDNPYNQPENQQLKELFHQLKN